MNCVWKPLRVYSDMTLDPRYFFPSVITFIFSCVSIFYALSINNYKGTLFIAIVILPDLLNYFFLIPFQVCSRMNHSLFHSKE